MKLTRTQRLIRVVQMLQAGRRCTVDSLARELGVTRRSVFRDMRVLRQAGIACVFDEDAQTYRLDQSFYLRPIDLTLHEGLSLLFVMRKLIDARIVPDAPSAVSACMKVEASLPDDIREHCGRLLEGVQVCGQQVSDVDAATDILFRIEDAIAEHRKLRLGYDSYYEKQRIETVLRPYRLVFRRRGWYVVGHSEKHREVRTFKLERIFKLAVLDARFRPDRSFDLDEHFGNAWHMVRGDQRHHVEVHFSSKVAGNVEEVAWHKTQRTRRRTDGTLVFEVDVDGLEEISWWIMGYGDQAVVREPEALRRLILSHARAMVHHYVNDTETPKARA